MLTEFITLFLLLIFREVADFDADDDSEDANETALSFACVDRRLSEAKLHKLEEFVPLFFLLSKVEKHLCGDDCEINDV